jgi:hypothetical protein
MHATLTLMTPQEIMRTIAEPTGPIGSAFYFHPDTMARGKELGLDGFRFYVLGRGGVLGDVDAAVVHAAFGYFHPDMISNLWNSAKEVMAPRDGAREYLACAHAMARTTGLPPYTYNQNPAAISVGRSPYIWARNLLANRLFECPVIYLEPYVMNNQEVHDRIQLGDYPGRRNISGTPRESIYREYVRGVVDGLVDYYGRN